MVSTMVNILFIVYFHPKLLTVVPSLLLTMDKWTQHLEQHSTVQLPIPVTVAITLLAR